MKISSVGPDLKVFTALLGASLVNVDYSEVRKFGTESGSDSQSLHSCCLIRKVIHSEEESSMQPALSKFQSRLK